MGLSSVFGGGSSKTKIIDPRSKEQKEAMSTLLPPATQKGLERIERAGEPYTGQFVAPMSSLEERGLGLLGGLLDRPLPQDTDLMGATRDQLEKTLTGEEYDPIGGAYYQAYRTQVMRELEEAKDRLAAETSARDKYFGGGRIATTGELEESALGDLAMVLGSLFENERVRRLDATQPAMQFSSVEEMLPLSRVEATQTYGGLPRSLEQMDLDAQYNEYIRQLNDLGIPLDVALGLATNQIPYMVKQGSGGTNWGGIAQAIATMFSGGMKA